MDLEAFHAGRHFYALDAERLHPQAERALGAVVGEALERASVDRDRVALYVMHYLDHRVALRAASAAGLPSDRVIATAEPAGHIGAAGLPLALADAVAAGRVGPGDLVCAAAFGAGISWGAAVLRL
jgi:3-oxoacyl-[acyl-carrier-protein] synthase-3